MKQLAAILAPTYDHVKLIFIIAVYALSIIESQFRLALVTVNSVFMLPLLEYKYVDFYFTLLSLSKTTNSIYWNFVVKCWRLFFLWLQHNHREDTNGRSTAD